MCRVQLIECHSCGRLNAVSDWQIDLAIAHTIAIRPTTFHRRRILSITLLCTFRLRDHLIKTANARELAVKWSGSPGGPIYGRKRMIVSRAVGPSLLPRNSE